MHNRKFLLEKNKKKKKTKKEVMWVQFTVIRQLHTLTAWGCQLNKKQLILQHKIVQMHKQ